MRVGLLGGSFNPAHDGHVEISTRAHNLLGLDQVWWIVALQNPLKATKAMAGFQNRMANARNVAKTVSFIKVLDIEERTGRVYTIDVIREIKRHYRKDDFVWIMGDDNIKHFHQWKNWPELIEEIPIVIMSRSNDQDLFLGTRFATRMRKYRVSPRALMEYDKGAWSALKHRINPLSATSLRNGGKIDKFMV